MISPGTVLRIPVREKNYGFIEVNGYIEPSTPEKEAQTIREVGEYLTYISPFSYEVRANGSLKPINDTAILNAAKNHRIAPLLVIVITSYSIHYTKLYDVRPGALKSWASRSLNQTYRER